MSHHGWVPVIDRSTLTPSALKSPFGRLFPTSHHTYHTHAIAMLAGALGPMQNNSPGPDARKNPTGFTFLGQFIDHDLTEFRVIGDLLQLIHQNPTIQQRQVVFEDSALLGQEATTTNGRTGKFDLDSVYGLLGVAQPDLYDPDGMFILHNNVDIKRDVQFNNQRLIADPRNDENKIVVQVHILFELLHNKIHGLTPGSTAQKGPGGTLFIATKKKVKEIYQNIVLHDYLPRLVPKKRLVAVAKKLKAGKAFYQDMNRRCLEEWTRRSLNQDDLSVAMPVEFSHAVFRLGHTQLRNGYLLNSRPRVSDPNLPNAFPLFAAGVGGADLRGNQILSPAAAIPGPLNEDFLIEWKLFFNLGNGVNAELGEPIDGNLPQSIFRLPPPAIDSPPVSLAERNIRRGIDFGLPSGQEAATYLTDRYGYIEATSYDQLFPPAMKQLFPEILQIEPSLAWNTPLWYYILRESEALEPGPHLGPVGSYIVAETILGSLYSDLTSAAQQAAFVTSVSGLAPDPETLSPNAPANPANIQTMAQLINYLNP